jgi:hypothetical protein
MKTNVSEEAMTAQERTLKKKRDYLRRIATWQVLTVLAAGALLLNAFLWLGIGYSEAVHFGQGVEDLVSTGIQLMVLFLSYIIPGLAGAIGLLRAEEWGRKLSIVHAIMSLIVFPIGTVVGAIFLRYLIRKDVKDYFIAGGK